MATRSIPLPAPAWYPSNDAVGFASARISIKQSSIAVPSPRYLEWIFSTVAAEYVVCSFQLPQNFVAETGALDIYYKMTTAIANEITWGVLVNAVSSGDAQDMDADSFDLSTGSIVTVTVPGTAGYMEVAAITISTGGDEGMVAGDFVTFALFRDPATPGSDADSDAEFLGADFRYSDT